MAPMREDLVMLRRIACTAAAVAAVGLIALAGPAGAEPTTPRPPGGDFGSCYVAPNSDFGCEGAICWCCHTDGCFICDQDFAGCEWDPAYRIQAGVLSRGDLQLQPNQPNQTFTAPLLDGQRAPGAQQQR
jgi:hypothetical protein